MNEYALAPQNIFCMISYIEVNQIHQLGSKNDLARLSCLSNGFYAL